MKINRNKNRLEKLIMKVVDKECKPRETSFWGQKCKIEPAYAGVVDGDGLQIVYLQPLDARPDYYVLRIDSSRDLDADDFDWEMLLCACEEQFDSYESYEWSWINGEWMGVYRFEKSEPPIKYEWPMVQWSGGCWGVIKNFKQLPTAS